MVRLRRCDKAVIVAIGLSRTAPDPLAEQLTGLIPTPDRDHP
jgi:hypothetical protein